MNKNDDEFKNQSVQRNKEIVDNPISRDSIQEVKIIENLDLCGNFNQENKYLHIFY